MITYLPPVLYGLRLRRVIENVEGRRLPYKPLTAGGTA